jgi:hypothetical protein
VLRVYRRALPISIQPKLTQQMEDEAYDTFANRSRSPHLGLQVYQHAIMKAINNASASLQLSVIAEAKKHASSRHSIPLRKRHMDLQVAGIEVAEWADDDHAAAYEYSISQLEEAGLSPEHAAIAMVHSQGQGQYPPRGSGGYGSGGYGGGGAYNSERRVPNQDCDICGRNHVGGRMCCYHVIDLNGNTVDNLMLDVAQRMIRSAPLIAREICKSASRHSSAWCFPGGPPAATCAVAALIRTIVQQGELFVYSSQSKTKRAVTLDEIDRTIAEYAGKLQPCSVPDCPNKTTDFAQSPYPKELHRCCVWKSGTEHCNNVVRARRGMGPTDICVMVAHLDWEDSVMPSWGSNARDVAGGQHTQLALPPPTSQHAPGAAAGQLQTYDHMAGAQPPVHDSSPSLHSGDSSQQPPFCQDMSGLGK